MSTKKVLYQGLLRRVSVCVQVLQSIFILFHLIIQHLIYLSFHLSSLQDSIDCNTDTDRELNPDADREPDPDAEGEPDPDAEGEPDPDVDRECLIII